MKEFLEGALFAAVEAGNDILKVYETEFDVEYKDDRSPLTEADKRANLRIIEMLNRFGIPFLTEEEEATAYEGRKSWRKVWIVDPLDGTKEFVKRNGEFTVNIALAEDGMPVLGVIYAPVFKDLYFGAKSFGSYKVERHDVIELLNTNAFNLENLMKKAHKLPMTRKKEKYTVVASRSHLNSETHHYLETLKKTKGEIELINSGSSLKMCLVAEGVADEYPRFGPTMEWDTAAGQAILESAGAKLLRDEDKQPMTYNRENLRNPSFIALRD
jgi:3'(2'), 5'-bisphosphate nucleotidase